MRAGEQESHVVFYWREDAAVISGHSVSRSVHAQLLHHGAGAQRDHMTRWSETKDLPWF